MVGDEVTVNWQTTKRRHGTASGYRFHQELGERPCDPCHRAKTAYDVGRRSAPAATLKNRSRAHAQTRAQLRLARIHSDEYRVLYLEELAAIDAGVTR